MGRPRKTDRHDDFDMDDRVDARADRDDREPERDDFETEMFSESAESPMWISPEWWPDGQEMRWISVEVTGQADNKNWSLKTTAHWVPYKRGTVKAIDEKFPTIAMPGSGPANEESIIFGGLCLCQRDRRYGMRDRQRQQQATRDAAKTVETYVEGGNANFPRVNMTKPVEYERGVRPAAFKE